MEAQRRHFETFPDTHNSLKPFFIAETVEKDL
jgi:hypothetical protein